MKGKPYIALFCLLLLVGCAGRQKVEWMPKESPVHQKTTAMMSSIVRVADPQNIKSYRLAITYAWEPYAYIDGYQIVLSNGLINITDDDQLRCVGAHEVSHKTLGHYSKRVAASTAVTVGMMAANILVPGVGLLNHVINPAITKTFSRAQEFDADRESVRIVSHLGVPKQSCIEMLEKLLNYAENSKKPKGGGLWSSHPELKERIERLKQDN